jgi:hypothetical protein
MSKIKERNVKLAEEREISKINYDNVVLVFVGAQMLLAFFQFFPLAIDISDNYIRLYYRLVLIFICGYLVFAYRKIKTISAM